MSTGRPDRALSVLTWHVHGNYLWYLSAVPVRWYLPVRPEGGPGYGGRGASFEWGDNVVEVPVDELGDLDVDVVLHQSHRDLTVDRRAVLDDRLRSLPTVVLEHDPPRDSPTDTRHPADGVADLLVHVTHYNRLMWDAGSTPAITIPHGVWAGGDPPHTTEPRALVVVNHLGQRGRRLGADLVEAVGERVPLDLVGMGSEELGGLGEVPPRQLREVVRRYRCFFHPARYTSLGLAVCEAMHEGVPIVGLPTTELPAIVRSGVDGLLASDIEGLAAAIGRLVEDPDLARRMGANAQQRARAQLSIEAFVTRWFDVLRHVARRPDARPLDPAGVTGAAGGLVAASG
jgi:glycosyltransferase involved in cell wall biosynthesis